MKKLFAFLVVVVLLTAMPVVAEQLSIHWTPSLSTNIVRNVIYRSTLESMGFVAIDSLAYTTSADTIYIDKNVPAGTRYYYRLRCVASDGQRSVLSTAVVSGVFLVTTDVQSVKVTSVVKTAPNTYLVTWTTTVPTAGFIRYRIQNGTWLADVWDVTLKTTHTTTLSGLLEPSTYEFKASGYTAVAPIYLTTSVSFSATLAPVPQAPTVKAIYPL